MRLVTPRHVLHTCLNITYQPQTHALYAIPAVQLALMLAPLHVSHVNQGIIYSLLLQQTHVQTPALLGITPMTLQTRAFHVTLPVRLARPLAPAHVLLASQVITHRLRTYARRVALPVRPARPLVQVHVLPAIWDTSR